MSHLTTKEKRPKQLFSLFKSFVVQVTGLPPVAALADKQSFRLFGPSDKLPLAIFSLSSPSIYSKENLKTNSASRF